MESRREAYEEGREERERGRKEVEGRDADRLCWER